ncbi:MAG: class I SAM-dependent methyltransferase [Francisellaceae bacterium]|jgi:SAM-dependent methyltransferase|nr:class I SAM-dependent methyltransferase [Francisellaceae bacterium]MBT6207966.1 class I SAM-dependent methyltransferase [Francisellaceae bacterium]
MDSTANLISHSSTSINTSTIFANIEKLLSPTLPKNILKKMASELFSSNLGKFLLENKGLNGYWTSYAITGGLKQDDLSEIEYWMIHKSPLVLATRERFHIFQEAIQNKLKDNMIIASLPCGLMDDLLTLDYSQVHNIHLVGIDLDNDSLGMAKHNAQIKNLTNVDFLQADAWQLNINNEFDIITSNGLNIYEPQYKKILALYQSLNQSLKPGGTLITSFLTPPPSLTLDSPWTNYVAEDLIKQKAIFADIIGTAWQNFTLEIDFIKLLETVGFTNINITYDKQRMFPTIIATK